MGLGLRMTRAGLLVAGVNSNGLPSEANAREEGAAADRSRAGGRNPPPGAEGLIRCFGAGPPGLNSSAFGRSCLGNVKRPRPLLVESWGMGSASAGVWKMLLARALLAMRL